MPRGSRKKRIARSNRMLISYERGIEAATFTSYKRLAKQVRSNPNAVRRIEKQVETWRKNDLEVILRRWGLRAALSHGELLFSSPGVKSVGGLEQKSFRDVFRKSIQAWTAENALRRSKTIAEGLIGKIRKRLVSAQSEGLGEAATARSLGDLIQSRSAAARIARTEAHTAAERGSHEAAQSLGIDMVKEWGATEGGRTRPTHARADGQIKELDEKFDVGADKLLHPGDPNGSAKEIINCRCVSLHHPRINGEIIR